MSEPLTSPTQTRLEHAEAARLWLLSAADQIHEERWPKQKRSLIDLGRLIVADAKESILADQVTSLPNWANEVQSIASYDDWLVEIVNFQVQLLSHQLSGDPAATLPCFSRADLELALSMRHRTRCFHKI
jgi:hypothetical protein